MASALDRQCKGSGLVRWGPGQPLSQRRHQSGRPAANRRWSHEGRPLSSFLGGPLLRSRRSQRLGTATINTWTRQALEPCSRWSLTRSDKRHDDDDDTTTRRPRARQSNQRPLLTLPPRALPPPALAPPRPSAPAHRRHCPRPERSRRIVACDLRLSLAEPPTAPPTHLGRREHQHHPHVALDTEFSPTSSHPPSLSPPGPPDAPPDPTPGTTRQPRALPARATPSR